MFSKLTRFAVVAIAFAFSCSFAFGFTYSIDGGPAGSVPTPYNDGTLITCTAPGVFTSTNVLSGYPIDAIHIGTPIQNVLRKTENGYQIVSPIFFSINDGSPFPIGAANASATEIYVSNKWNSGVPDGGYGTATIGALTNGLSTLPATEPNLNLGPSGKAYNDNLDALSLRNYSPNADMVFFSIDDFVPFVPNSSSSMQTGDIFVRLPNTGSVIKVLDAVSDIGLYYSDRAPFISAFHDDIASLIIVETDDNTANNKFITVKDPATGQDVRIDLGDGILFTVDGNLPGDYVPSLVPRNVYFSSLDGSAPIKVLDGITDLGLSSQDQIDALAAFGSDPVPEPGTMLLVGTGLMGFAGLLRRKGMKA